MIGQDYVGPRNAWLLLLLVSVASFFAAEFMGERHVAVAAIMAIAAAKVVVILLRFMEIDRAPAGVRYYLYGWASGCAGVIFALWWAARP